MIATIVIVAVAVVATFAYIVAWAFPTDVDES